MEDKLVKLYNTIKKSSGNQKVLNNLSDLISEFSDGSIIKNASDTKEALRDKLRRRNEAPAKVEEAGREKELIGGGESSPLPDSNEDKPEAIPAPKDEPKNQTDSTKSNVNTSDVKKPEGKGKGGDTSFNPFSKGSKAKGLFPKSDVPKASVGSEGKTPTPKMEIPKGKEKTQIEMEFEEFLKDRLNDPMLKIYEDVIRRDRQFYPYGKTLEEIFPEHYKEVSVGKGATGKQVPSTKDAPKDAPKDDEKKVVPAAPKVEEVVTEYIEAKGPKPITIDNDERLYKLDSGILSIYTVGGKFLYNLDIKTIVHLEEPRILYEKNVFTLVNENNEPYNIVLDENTQQIYNEAQENITQPEYIKEDDEGQFNDVRLPPAPAEGVQEAGIAPPQDEKNKEVDDKISELRNHIKDTIGPNTALFNVATEIVNNYEEQMRINPKSKKLKIEDINNIINLKNYDEGRGGRLIPSIKNMNIAGKIKAAIPAINDMKINEFRQSLLSEKPTETAEVNESPPAEDVAVAEKPSGAAQPNKEVTFAEGESPVEEILGHRLYMDFQIVNAGVPPTEPAVKEKYDKIYELEGFDTSYHTKYKENKELIDSIYHLNMDNDAYASSVNFSVESAFNRAYTVFVLLGIIKDDSDLNEMIRGINKVSIKNNNEDSKIYTTYLNMTKDIQLLKDFNVDDLSEQDKRAQNKLDFCRLYLSESDSLEDILPFNIDDAVINIYQPVGEGRLSFAIKDVIDRVFNIAKIYEFYNNHNSERGYASNVSAELFISRFNLDLIRFNYINHIKLSNHWRSKYDKIKKIKDAEGFDNAIIQEAYKNNKTKADKIYSTELEDSSSILMRRSNQDVINRLFEVFKFSNLVDESDIPAEENVGAYEQTFDEDIISSEFESVLLRINKDVTTLGKINADTLSPELKVNYEDIIKSRNLLDSKNIIATFMNHKDKKIIISDLLKIVSDTKEYYTGEETDKQLIERMSKYLNFIKNKISNTPPTEKELTEVKTPADINPELVTEFSEQEQTAEPAQSTTETVYNENDEVKEKLSKRINDDFDKLKKINTDELNQDKLKKYNDVEKLNISKALAAVSNIFEEKKYELSSLYLLEEKNIQQHMTDTDVIDRLFKLSNLIQTEPTSEPAAEAATTVRIPAQSNDLGLSGDISQATMLGLVGYINRLNGLGGSRDTDVINYHNSTKEKIIPIINEIFRLAKKRGDYYSTFKTLKKEIDELAEKPNASKTVQVAKYLNDLISQFETAKNDLEAKIKEKEEQDSKAKQEAESTKTSELQNKIQQLPEYFSNAFNTLISMSDDQKIIQLKSGKDVNVEDYFKNTIFVIPSIPNIDDFVEKMSHEISNSTKLGDKLVEIWIDKRSNEFYNRKINEKIYNTGFLVQKYMRPRPTKKQEDTTDPSGTKQETHPAPSEKAEKAEEATRTSMDDLLNMIGQTPEKSVAEPTASETATEDRPPATKEVNQPEKEGRTRQNQNQNQNQRALGRLLSTRTEGAPGGLAEKIVTPVVEPEVTAPPAEPSEPPSKPAELPPTPQPPPEIQEPKVVKKADKLLKFIKDTNQNRDIVIVGNDKGNKKYSLYRGEDTNNEWVYFEGVIIENKKAKYNNISQPEGVNTALEQLREIADLDKYIKDSNVEVNEVNTAKKQGLIDLNSILISERTINNTNTFNKLLV
jgi:hypothetical protein